MLGLQLDSDMHGDLAGGRVKKATVQLQLRLSAEPEQVPRPRAREPKHRRPDSSDTVKREAGRGLRSERGSVIM